jgi:Bacterial SH3 domain
VRGRAPYPAAGIETPTTDEASGRFLEADRAFRRFEGVSQKGADFSYDSVRYGSCGPMGSERERPFSVDVPRAGEDRPAWVKVGVIAAVGFAVGVAWPRIAGVRLGPSAPGESSPSAATSAGPAPRASEPTAGTAPAVLATAPTAPPSGSAAAPSGPPHVVVSRGAIVSCKSDDGEVLKGQGCGQLAGIDNLVQPRIRRLKDCSAAEGATGKLAVTFGVDFANNRLDVAVGKNSSVPNLESIAGCVKHEFGGISLGAMEHDHPRYTVSYTATLSAAEAATAAAGSGAPGAAAGSGASPTPVALDAPTSSVVWEVAIVRDSPRSGAVVGRLQRGTKVRVGQGQDNWYRVRYGGNYSSEGWVYRGAIGR